MIKKGSFSVYTVPYNPSPRETYNIVIITDLPDNKDQYNIQDLSGNIRGTDGFNFSFKGTYNTRHLKSDFY